MGPSLISIVSLLFGLSIKVIIQKKKKIVGKFRPRLIELTSFKPKLLIRFIMNKTC